MAVPAKKPQRPLGLLFRRTVPLLWTGVLLSAAAHGFPQLPQNRGLPSSLAPQLVQYLAIFLHLPQFPHAFHFDEQGRISCCVPRVS